ncbi:hypothetical protein HVA01_09070 [Halovibrio variabilis]|uniref:Transposase n=1 Tax=Halovibrio variabilis TaxID=31910 RepID=A0A511UMK1_9GAMM|nr:hypothetical protein HVA01_09070 [Halovibrio variabilis]
MARLFISLTLDEQQVLNEAYQHGEKRALRRRAHAILLSHQGYTIDQISSILKVQRNAVADSFKQWKASGLEGLADKPRGGRPSILNDADRASLQQLVEEHPHQLPVLQARLQGKTGKVFSRSTLRRALKKTVIASSESDTP